MDSIIDTVGVVMVSPLGRKTFDATVQFVPILISRRPCIRLALSASTVRRSRGVKVPVAVCMCVSIYVTFLYCAVAPGRVFTEHGILPVPAPATLNLMIGMKVVAGPPTSKGLFVVELRTFSLIFHSFHLVLY